MHPTEPANDQLQPGRHSVLLVDNHPVVREALATLLSHEADFNVVGEATTAAEAKHALARLKPALMVLDLSLPDGHGLELIKDIRGAHPFPFRGFWCLAGTTSRSMPSERCGPGPTVTS